MNNIYWSDSKNAKEWIEQNKRRTESGEHNTTIESTNIVLKEIMSRNDFNSILEVGAGDGRLIGALSNNSSKECYSMDVNKKLSKYVKKNYPKVTNYVSDIVDASLQITDNAFDLVFTYQVLQHIPPESIEQAIKELCRIANKEVWMWEGIGRVDYKHGDKTHDINGGSWVWDISKLVDCYEVSIPKNEFVELSRQRLYKVKYEK